MTSTGWAPPGARVVPPGRPGGIAEGRFPARAFNDQPIYDSEQDRLFSRAWCFLAHEIGDPLPGRLRPRYIADNAIIVVRDEDGQPSTAT